MPMTSPAVLTAMTVRLTSGFPVAVGSGRDGGVPAKILTDEVTANILTFFDPNDPEGGRIPQVGFLDAEGKRVDVGECRMTMGYRADADNPEESAVLFTFRERKVPGVDKILESREVRISRRELDEVMEKQRKFMLRMAAHINSSAAAVEMHQEDEAAIRQSFEMWQPVHGEDVLQQIYDRFFENERQLAGAHQNLENVDATRRANHTEGTDQMHHMFKAQGVEISDMRMMGGLHTLCMVLLDSPGGFIERLGGPQRVMDVANATDPLHARRRAADVTIDANATPG